MTERSCSQSQVTGPLSPTPQVTACFSRTPLLAATTHIGLLLLLPPPPPTSGHSRPRPRWATTYRDGLAGTQHVLGRELVGDLLPFQHLPLDPPVPQRLVLAQGTRRLTPSSGRTLPGSCPAGRQLPAEAPGPRTRVWFLLSGQALSLFTPRQEPMQLRGGSPELF